MGIGCVSCALLGGVSCGVSCMCAVFPHAAPCAKRGQKVPNGYYSLERMLRPLTRQQGGVGVCGSCMDARGVTDSELVEGAHRGSMDELTDWSLWADRVIVF